MNDPDDWIQVHACKEMDDYAKEYDRIMKKQHGQGSKPLSLYHNETGGRGQWAFRQIMLIHSIPFQETPIFEDHGDEYDYLAPRFGTIDVKTGSVGSSPVIDRVEVNDDQLNKKIPVTAYVFCRWDVRKQLVHIVGWSYWEEYPKMATFVPLGGVYEGWGPKDPCWVCKIYRLRPIKPLLRMLGPLKV